MSARLERRTDLSLVQLVRVAEPCPLAGDGWEKGPRARFCERCVLDVHTLSAMTAGEAAGASSRLAGAVVRAV
ncbi:MAG: hypothetical protein IT435_03350 [Phycisphaerales bacterium]|nr:hypothetical protein [Phycisphaerales bacterium]